MGQDQRFRKKMRAGKALRYCFLFCIFLFFGITRLWQLSQLPFGVNIDEAGMAYDAWCLSEYGVDRYLKPWPLYLVNFGGGQSIMYAYLCAGLIKIFGYSIQIIRMPAVIFSFLNLVFGMKLAERLYPNRPFTPLAVGGLLTVCPYFIMAGRFGLDCNLMLGMSTIFLYCFIVAIGNGKLSRYFVAGIAGGLLLYTYVLSYVILPLFFVLAMVYLLRVKKFSPRGWAAMAIPLGILAFPLVLVQIVNLFGLEESKLGCFTVTKLGFYRGSEVGMFGLAKLRQALESIFLGDTLAYNSAPGYTNLYKISVVFAIVGIGAGLVRLWKSLKKREARYPVLVLLWFASVLFFESHIEVCVSNINAIFFSVVLLAVEGIELFREVCARLVRVFVKGKEMAVGYVVWAVLCCVYLFCFANFGAYYFGGTYSAETYLLPYFDLTISEALEFIEQDTALCQKVTQMAESQIYYALSALENPYEMQMEMWQGQAVRYKNYWICCLGEISEEYNYIVRDGFEEYCALLREAGFTEERFTRYSLFYKK